MPPRHDASEENTSARIPVEHVFQSLLGMAYCHWWIWKSALGFFLEKYATRFLFASLGLLILEIGLEFLGRDFGKAALYLKIAFVVAITITAIDKYRELKKKQDDFLFLGSTYAVSSVLADSPVSKEAMVRAILKQCQESFAEEGAGVSVTLALREEDRGTLAIEYREPDHGERVTRFNNFEGGVGYAYGNKTPVYIPSTRFGQGIVWKIGASAPFAVETKVYKRHSRETRQYKAILSLPVVILGRCFGTLSVDSTRRNPFRKSHLLKGMYFATSVAQVLHFFAPRIVADSPSASSRGRRLTKK